jgi:hypothetical protein
MLDRFGFCLTGAQGRRKLIVTGPWALFRRVHKGAKPLWPKLRAITPLRQPEPRPKREST